MSMTISEQPTLAKKSVFVRIMGCKNLLHFVCTVKCTDFSMVADLAPLSFFSYTHSRELRFHITRSYSYNLQTDVIQTVGLDKDYSLNY